MVDQTSNVKKPSRLWRRILVLSLALNLAVAGLFIGAVASGRLADGPPPRFEVGLGPFGRSLTDDEKREIRHSLMRDRTVRDLNLRGGMTNMAMALQADPFDPEAVGGLMVAQVARTAQVQSKFQEALLAVIIDMTPERRVDYAEELLESQSRERPSRTERPSGG